MHHFFMIGMRDISAITPKEIRKVNTLIMAIPNMGFITKGGILYETSKCITSIWTKYIPKLYFERIEIIFDVFSQQ